MRQLVKDRIANHQCSECGSTLDEGETRRRCADCRTKKAEVDARFHAYKRKQVFDAYGNCCAYCGETEPMVLTIDHILNDGFKEKWPSGSKVSATIIYARIIKEGFPKDRYQILCANHNQMKNLNGGILPEKKTIIDSYIDEYDEDVADCGLGCGIEGVTNE